MTLAEMAQVVGIVGGLSGLSLGLYGALSARQLRRQGADEETRKAVNLLERELEILKVRIGPILKVMDAHTATLFHQPHPGARELDALLERYEADTTDYKWSVSIEELNRLVTLTELQMVEEASQHDALTPPDPWKSFAQASLKGIRDARVVLREQEQREQQWRVGILRSIQEGQAALAQEESWWSRLRRYLSGSSSS